MQTVVGRWSARGEFLLLVGASLYVLGTVIAQWFSSLPSFRDGSALETSSDVAASCGLALAVVLARTRWSWPLVRRNWLFGAAGMLLIWGIETAVDKLVIDFRLVIGVWALATILLVIALRPYAMHRRVIVALQFGIAAQVVAHADLFILKGVLHVHRDTHMHLAAINDLGELCAVLCYLVAFFYARNSTLELHSQDRTRLSRWASLPPQGSNARARVCFSYIAQNHQIPHSLPIAVALARDEPSIDVHIAGRAQQLCFVRDALAARGVDVPLTLDELEQPIRGRLGLSCKKRMLSINALYFSGFDAVVVPERTSTYLRKLPLPQTRLIGTEHGAGDREVTFSPDIARYDFLMLAGQKQARRLLELGYARADRLATGIYAKLDWMGAAAPLRRRFANDRPTVLYNPHFESGLSSWHAQGWAVLDYFARSMRYNLIFAPHVRLFDPPTPTKYSAFARYRQLPHLHIDLGSERSVDMSYTAEADLYLGDVSSQTVEFLTRPRPCVFLNAHGVAWQDDLHFRFWQLGPVIVSVDALDEALQAAFSGHPLLIEAQRAYVADSFGEVQIGRSATRGAAAITEYLRSAAPSSSVVETDATSPADVQPI